MSRIRGIINKLDQHTLEVAKKSSKTMIVKITGMVIALFVSVFLGRTLGPEGLGTVDLAIKLGILLLVITMFGFPMVIVKQISIAYANQNFKDIASKIKTSLIFNGFLSLCIATIGALSLPVVIDLFFDNQDLYLPFSIAFVMLIPQSIARVYGSALNGIGKIWQANLVDKTLSYILVGIGLLVFWVFNVEFNVISVLVLFGISRIILAIVVKVIWDNSFNYKVKGNIHLKLMLKMGAPLLLVSGTTIIASNVDVIMLGFSATLKDVGMYSVAAQLAILTSFFLQVSNAAIAPKIASLFNEKKIREIQVMVQRVTIFLAMAAILFVMFFVLFGELLLSFWGADFQEAYWILLVLAIGQVFNLATGCSGILLIMCGYEKVHGWISLISLILNIILNIVLINYYGAFGAAIATTITLMLSNIIKVYIAKNKTGVLTIPVFINREKHRFIDK